jgi:hypothetical protein
MAGAHPLWGARHFDKLKASFAVDYEAIGTPLPYVV